MPRKIILDCDPGQDDAVAMLLAHGSPAIELLAITTIGGNQTLAKVTANALAIATLLGIEGIPVAAGCERPLVQPLRTAAHIHGESGLDGVDLPEPAVALDPRHAVDLIIELVMTHEPQSITLVPTGPLTNIAMALRKEPRIGERVAAVVLMGGGYHTGNESPVAEFNVATDPEAAHIVFSEPWPLVMVGLDLTHQAVATDEVIARVAQVEGTAGRFLGQVLAAYASAYRANRGFAHPPVHDPCAVAHVIDPTVVVARPTPLSVELTGSLTRGMTVADFRPEAPADGHTQAAVTLDHPRFWDLVIDAAKRLG